MPEDGEVSILELVERQRQLEEAARRRYPWDPSQCTLYMDIPPRQLLYACLTCEPKNAICYACAIRCHAGHNVVELYSKRGYRCDCGTTRIPHSHCTLRQTRENEDESPNTHLHYGQNFEGKFCVCSESVDDPGYGDGAMFQCLLGTQCGEDWFHARCIVGISREEEKVRQERSEGEEPDHGNEEPEHRGQKRKLGEEDSEEPADGPESKRPDRRTHIEEPSNDPETRPDIDFEEEEESGDELDAVYPELPASFGALICKKCAECVPQLIDSEAVLAKVNGYVFLKENYGEIIRNSEHLRHLLAEHPYLDGKESTYKPDMDEDQSSLLEAGERALESLPRDAVLDGITKFNELQSNLMNYLRQIGSDGHAITEEEIRQFFVRKQ